MKRTIRRSVFETNSSSTHSLVLCSEEDYNKWKNGEIEYDMYNNKFVPCGEGCDISEFEDSDGCFRKYITKSGEVVVGISAEIYN